MGIQSLNQASLFAVGRFTGLPIMQKALEVVALWPTMFNIDIMAGLPHQNINNLIDTLHIITKLKVAHISFYSLTLEEETPLALIQAKKNILPSAKMAESMWLEGHKLLQKQGYSWYETSNYALASKFTSLHNLRYWHLQSYLGVGPAAVSTLVLKDGRALRLNSPKDLKLWQNRAPNFDIEVINQKDFIFEHFMMALRTSEGLNVRRFFKRFNINASSITDKLAPKWQACLTKSNGYIKLNANGLQFLDALLLDLL
jgi:oxygen-independent coproporphyrinogen-3 oxidase